jgi:ankyrin repeat protein
MMHVIAVPVLVKTLAIFIFCWVGLSSKATASVPFYGKRVHAYLMAACAAGPGKAGHDTIPNFAPYCDVNALDINGASPLHIVCATRPEWETVGLLLRLGSKINSVDIFGCTPLHYACAYGTSLLVIRYLIQQGALINHCACYGQTPLHEACSAGRDFEVISELVRLGADVFARDHMGYTPYDLAILNRLPLEVCSSLCDGCASTRVIEPACLDA